MRAPLAGLKLGAFDAKIAIVARPKQTELRAQCSLPTLLTPTAGPNLLAFARALYGRKIRTSEPETDARLHSHNTIIARPRFLGAPSRLNAPDKAQIVRLAPIQSSLASRIGRPTRAPIQFEPIVEHRSGPAKLLHAAAQNWSSPH